MTIEDIDTEAGGVNPRKAPFPYNGGKRDAAPQIWEAIGDVPHYCEPFAGSLANLLERPHPCNRTYYSETVNDKDGLIVNVWRSIQLSPEETARWASWPVSEADKIARQLAALKWVQNQELEHLMGDDAFHCPKVAGYWLYGLCCQIGAVRGPWIADPETGRLMKRAGGVSRDLPHLGNNGRGVNHPGTREPGVSRDLPHLGNDGRGVNRPQLREPGVSPEEPDDTGEAWAPEQEFHPVTMPELIRWFRWLSARLRHVRILNGDWKRLVTSGASKTLPVRQGKGPAGIFLDPPYANEERSSDLYREDCGSVAKECLEWCKAHGDDPQLRIVLAGYDTEHAELETMGWRVVEWFKSGFLKGGYGNIAKGNGTGDNQQHRERLWLSPHCLLPPTPVEDRQRRLFVEDE